jgi:hypothetical protein
MNRATIHHSLLAAIALSWIGLAPSGSVSAVETGVIWIEAEDYAATNFGDQWQSQFDG